MEKRGRLLRTRKGHRPFEESDKRGTITVAGKLNVHVPPGTLNSVLKQVGLK